MQVKRPPETIWIVDLNIPPGAPEPLWEILRGKNAPAHYDEDPPGSFRYELQPRVDYVPRALAVLFFAGILVGVIVTAMVLS